MCLIIKWFIFIMIESEFLERQVPLLSVILQKDLSGWNAWLISFQIPATLPVTELVNQTFHLFKPASLSQIQTLRERESAFLCDFTKVNVQSNVIECKSSLLPPFWVCKCTRNNIKQRSIICFGLLSIWMLLFSHKIYSSRWGSQYTFQIAL